MRARSENTSRIFAVPKPSRNRMESKTVVDPGETLPLMDRCSAAGVRPRFSNHGVSARVQSLRRKRAGCSSRLRAPQLFERAVHRTEMALGQIAHAGRRLFLLLRAVADEDVARGL